MTSAGPSVVGIRALLATLIYVSFTWAQEEEVIVEVHQTCEHPDKTLKGFPSEDGSRCYYMSLERSSVDEAALRCSSMGSEFSLVTAPDQTHNDFIARQVHALDVEFSDDTVWLGLGWNTTCCVWSTGQVVEWENWPSGAPNVCQMLNGGGYCAVMGHSGYWDVAFCTQRLHFICEGPPEEVPVPDRSMATAPQQNAISPVVMYVCTFAGVLAIGGIIFFVVGIVNYWRASRKNADPDSKIPNSKRIFKYTILESPVQKV